MFGHLVHYFYSVRVRLHNGKNNFGGLKPQKNSFVISAAGFNIRMK